MDIKEVTKQSKKEYRRIWQENDLPQMALHSIDTLTIYIQDGMDKDEAIGKIYMFAHCTHKTCCYDVHDGWRNELKKFFLATFIKNKRV